MELERKMEGRAAHLSRRNVLKFAATTAISSSLPSFTFSGQTRPKVAAIYTELRYRSHAYNILINLMGPYLFRGKRVDPGVDVVAFYADQFPDNDMSRDVARRFKIPLYKSIDEALCCGGKSLAVDAVLLIGEHGDYPRNEFDQVMYPRKEFFDQSVAVMRRSSRFVPIFNDKHLSYRWDWAKTMYDQSRELGIPFLAGSSVPLADRRPPLDLPSDVVIDEAVSIHGGGIESYDFHGFEVLQSIIESRRGGETGITSVQLLTGDACRKAHDSRTWSPELVTAAMQAEFDGRFRRQGDRAKQPPSAPPHYPDHALVLTYRDGTRASVLKIGSTSDRWNFACRLKGSPKPLATAFFNGPWGNRNLFAALTNAIVHLYKTRQEAYPVERTLMASGVVDAAMKSNAENGRRIDTPHLQFSYKPRDYSSFRENGDSWNVITVDTPEPKTLEPGQG